MQVKIILIVVLTFLFVSNTNAQIYLADNGLTASGSGASQKVSLGGALLNAQTTIDFGSSNTSSNFLLKKGTSNYFFVDNSGNVMLNSTTSQGNYKFQVSGSIWNNGIIHMAATSPVLSFQLGTGAAGDYWIGRNANELTMNTASILHDKIGGNSWYNGSIANGHRWFDGAATPATLMQLKTDGELWLGTSVDNGAYRFQTNTPVAGNGIFIDASTNAGIGYKLKAKDQAWLWHGENGNAQVGLQNQISGTQWTLDAVNTVLNIQGRSADIKLITDAFADIYINPGRKLKLNLGSDAAGDIFYRNSTGDLTRLPVGTSGQVLTISAGVPTWAASSGGSSQWTTASSNIYYNTGKVGIGTTNLNDANYKLFVEGAIRSRKIRVDQLTWPDYVFDPQYNLPSLMEVEDFIKNNNHLPDVLSAKQVEENGIDLGDNQATLLKKIEELTLYIIQLDKKATDQEHEIAELKKQNSDLTEIKKQLDELNKMMIKK